MRARPPAPTTTPSYREFYRKRKRARGSRQTATAAAALVDAPVATKRHRHASPPPSPLTFTKTGAEHADHALMYALAASMHDEAAEYAVCAAIAEGVGKQLKYNQLSRGIDGTEWIAENARE